MSLYNRNYIQESTHEEVYAQANLSSFIKQTYQLLTASLIVAAAGAYIGTSVLKSFSWVLLIVELGLIFGLYAAKANKTLSLILLFAFTFISGFTLGPLLNFYVSHGMGSVVTQAFSLTAIAFGGLSVFAFNTKRDFSGMGKMLFITLIVVVCASLLNIFFKSPLLQVGIASVGAILFSAFIVYDTQNIVKGRYDSPVLAAVALYLDILNLFTSLLQILGIFGRDE